MVNEECFKQNTKPGSLSSLWNVWDLDIDGRVSKSEFASANTKMDLDQNGKVDFIEVEAYFAANNYLICRPLRDEIIYRHDDAVTSLNLKVDHAYKTLFTLQKQGNNSDVQWKKTSQNIFKNVCQTKYVVNYTGGKGQKTVGAL